MQSFYFLLSATLSLFAAKDTPSVSAPIFAPQTTDNWLPIVLKTLDEVPVDAPADAATYQMDWTITKNKVAKWSDDQKRGAQHWQISPILRWNELARQLVAAHNVPPRCLADSSGYPTPQRDHAADLPRYPFANPPYASRVFAYMSVAQHDAFLAAQFYQEKFQKMAVQTVVNDASTPVRAYPSTEAAVAAASSEVLAYLFPAEAEAIEEKAAIARESALLSGKYAQSDVDAGTKLGKAIAQKVIERAKIDGMDAAQGSKTQWEQIFSRHTEGGQLAWVSKQKPARPAIEPFFGNVKTWTIFDLKQMRPAAPPAANAEALKKELAIVRHYSLAQNKKDVDIAMRWADAEFTHTPIGHWNLIAGDLLRKHKSDDAHIVRTLALLNRALMDATILCWEAKTYYCYPRPSQVDPTIYPRLPLPNFPSYPSGHSTFSAAAATVLGNVFPDEAASLDKMAEEASFSRVYAALHFQMDCDAGSLLGKKVGVMSLEKRNR